MKRNTELSGRLLLCRNVTHQVDTQSGTIQTSIAFEPEAQGPDGIQGNYPVGYPAPSLRPPDWDQPESSNLIAYCDANGREIRARVIKYASTTSLTIGAEATVDANTGNRQPTVVSLSASKAIVCFWRTTTIYGCVLDISGTTITPGAVSALSGIATDATVVEQKLDIDRISSTSALLVYRNGSAGFNAVVLSVSGTTITTNTAANLTAVAIRQVSAVVLSSTVAIAFGIETGTEALDGFPMSLSGVAITAGTASAIEGVDDILGQSAAKIDAGSALVVYNNLTDAELQGRVISSIDGSTFTSNAAVTIDANAAFDVYGSQKWARVPSSTQGIVTWQTAAPDFKVYGAGLAISGSTFTPSNRVELGTYVNSYDEYPTCMIAGNSRAIVVYDESGVATVTAHARSFTFSGSTDPVADNNDNSFMTDTFNELYEFTSTTLE